MTIDLDEDDDTFEDAAGSTPGGSDDEFEEYDVPPVLVGVFRGHISESKKNPKKEHQLILEIKSEDAATGGLVTKVFLDFKDGRELQCYRKIATAVGCEVQNRPCGRFAVRGGIKALKNKPGMFVASTYHRPDGSVESSLARWVPKLGKSPEWDEYLKTADFNEAQLKAIASSSGVIDPQHHALFT